MLSRKVYFQSPHQSSIVVFDRANSQYITDFILKDEPCFIFDMRPEKIYISPKIFGYFFFSFHLICWAEIGKEKRLRSKLRVALTQLRLIFVLSCFKCIKPKVVITFIDNSEIFHWLVKKYKKAKFLSVQNGTRTNWEIGLRKRKHHHQHFFCFGDYDKDRYVKFGHMVDEYCPVGSLVAGYYRSNAKKKKEKKYDLAIVSQYTSSGFKLYSKTKKLSKQQISERREYEAAMNLMHSFLIRYIVEYNLKAAVLMRSTLNSSDKERNYYEEKYEGKVILFRRDIKKMTSYCVADESELVVGFNSTFLAESFGLGNKAVRIDFLGSDLRNDYDPMIMFTKPNYTLLKRRLNELRAEPYDEYRKRTKEYAAYLMNYNPDCPPHIFIR